MRMLLLGSLICILCGSAVPKERAAPPYPVQFEVARRTFYDFGPPFDFYELFLIRPEVDGISIERITVTPPGISCMQPAKVERERHSTKQTMEELLEHSNPCAIPEREVLRELKRCKKCAVFSGADIGIRAQCGSENRIIRSNILDKDMFDAAPKTPKFTFWTMQLLERLDQPFDSHVADKPVFAVPDERQIPPLDGSDTLRELSAGNYDALFPGSHKLSTIYRLAQETIPTPDVLIRTVPFRPNVLIPPIYPSIARMAHIEGVVELSFNIGADGGTSYLKFQSGHPMLRGAVEKAVSAWKFQPEAANQEVKASIEFKANCPSRPQ